jgi:hypothetical protein
VISFAFHPDAATRSQADSSVLAAQHPAYIRWTYFRALTSLAVGGSELLLPSNPRSYHRPLPLLDLGPWAQARVRSLAQCASMSYDCDSPGWCLSLTRNVGRIRLESFYNSESADVEYAGLLAAWERFSDDVRLYLMREVPHLRANPFWRRWLEGAEYEDLEDLRPPPPLDSPIIFQFEPGPEVVAADRRYDLSTESMAVLCYTYFEIPVRLQIGGVEFFSLQIPQVAGVTAPLPILGFALDGLRVLRLTRATGRGRYEIPESSPFFRFEMAGLDVLVQYHPLEPVATVRFETLYEAWQQFARRVCTYLVDLAPELGDNPEWKPSLLEAGLGDLA